MHAITHIRRMHRCVHPRPATLAWMKRTAHRVFRRRTQTRLRTRLRGRRDLVLARWYELVLDERPVLTDRDL